MPKFRKTPLEDEPLTRILGALTQKYSGPSWICGTEVAVGKRRFDFVAVCVAQGSTVVHGFEIKVSRSDFLAENRDRSKFLALQSCCNSATYATLQGIIDPSELPPGAGLMQLQGSRLVSARPALRNVRTNTSCVLAAVLRRTYVPSMIASLIAIQQALGLPTKPVCGFQSPKIWAQLVRQSLKMNKAPRL